VNTHNDRCDSSPQQLLQLLQRSVAASTSLCIHYVQSCKDHANNNQLGPATVEVVHINIRDVCDRNKRHICTSQSQQLLLQPSRRPSLQRLHHLIISDDFSVFLTLTTALFSTVSVLVFRFIY